MQNRATTPEWSGACGTTAAELPTNDVVVK
jgi:hypothetical protein